MEVATAEVQLEAGRVSVRRNSKHKWRYVSPLGGPWKVERDSDDEVQAQRIDDDPFIITYRLPRDRIMWYHSLLGITRGQVMMIKEGEQLAFNRRGIVCRKTPPQTP